MKPSCLTSLSAHLSPLEKVTFGALCATVIAVALWWRLGIFALCLLSTISIIKTLYTKASSPTTPTSSLSTTQKICLWAMVAYWILYALSASVSNDYAEGWSTAVIKLYFLVLPLACLVGNTAYLTQRHIKSLFQVFTVTLLLRFFACIVISGIQLLQGISLDQVKDWQIDPLGMHHNYLALYIDTAIAYLYTLVVMTPYDLRRKHWPLLFSAIVILVVYLFLISSRSGLVSLMLLFFTILIHITFFRKKFKIALAIALLSIALLAGLYLTVPSVFNRFIVLTQWTENYYPDDRVIAWICGLNATQGHLLFGYGSGDYMPHLVLSFQEFGYQRAIDNGYNTHCQYIETLLEMGIVGLIVFLFMLFAPLVTALINRRSAIAQETASQHTTFSSQLSILTVLTVIVVSSMNIFEVMYNRQMGTQFISLTYCLLILSQPRQAARTSPSGSSFFAK